MTAFTFDHIHLRSPDPEATAAFYERVFGVELRRSPQRIDFMLGGQAIFISPSPRPARRPPRPIAGWSISALRCGTSTAWWLS
jgi:lactoylglutathione lyase